MVSATSCGSLTEFIIVSDTPIRRPQRVKGPTAPANTGRSVISLHAASTDLMKMVVRPSPTCGSGNNLSDASSDTIGLVIAGTSLSLKRTGAPKTSASTERSIMLTDAADFVLSATAFIPRAMRSASPMSSRTVRFIRAVHGKDRIGSPCLTGECITSSSHFFEFTTNQPLFAFS